MIRRCVSVIFGVVFCFHCLGADPAPFDLADIRRRRRQRRPIFSGCGRIYRLVIWGSAWKFVAIKFKWLELNQDRQRKKPICAGDVVKSFAGESVSNIDVVRQRLANRHAGELIGLMITRDGRDIAITAKLQPISNPLRDPTLRPVLGVQLVEEMNGVKIEGVTPGSAAANAGLQVGDVVTRIDGSPRRRCKNCATMSANVGRAKI